MSRGHGRLQRALLDILDNHHGLLDTPDLVCRAFGLEPGTEATEAQMASVRRALAKLAKEGRVVLIGSFFKDRRARWANPQAAETYKARMVGVFGRRNWEGLRR